MSIDITTAKKRQQDEGALSAPIRGVIRLVIPEQEAVKVDQAQTSGAMPFPVRHPYMGVNSWIRVMPEEGTEVLTQLRGDNEKSAISAYVFGDPAGKIRLAENDQILFRVLRSGEMELMSSGRGYFFIGDGGDSELTGASEAGLTPWWAVWFLKRWPNWETRFARPGLRRFRQLRSPSDVMRLVIAPPGGGCR